ncbi:MAG: hypothetical protein RBS99_09650 [Rhodospirillales bacterium]|nr:hypothetical protein [Rhodospirillales bacterium]
MFTRGEPNRIPMIDLARFYGIVLVYYGHVVERMMYLGSSAAAHHYKFIYSFHMILFFVLAGFIAKERVHDLGLGDFVRSRLASRVVPFFFFNLLLAMFSLGLPRDFPPVPLASAGDYLAAAIQTLTTLPIFNIPTWFLMCLITVEILHHAVFRFLRASDRRILAAAVLFYIAGYAFNREFQFFDPGRSLTNYWFFNEAPVVYAFYLVGVVMRRRGFLTWPVRPAILAAGALAALGVVCLTYDLNQGPFRLIEAVVILASGHGDPLWFPLTAVVGSVMILLLARLSPPAAWMTFMGRNALTLFCLNGVVYHHVNGPVAMWTKDSLGLSAAAVLGVGAAATAVSLILAVPVVMLFNRAVPQLIGRPRERGPLLPNFL